MFSFQHHIWYELKSKIGNVCITLRMYFRHTCINHDNYEDFPPNPLWCYVRCNYSIRLVLIRYLNSSDTISDFTEFEAVQYAFTRKTLTLVFLCQTLLYKACVNLFSLLLKCSRTFRSNTPNLYLWFAHARLWQ